MLAALPPDAFTMLIRLAHGTPIYCTREIREIESAAANLPLMERADVATADEVDVETLAARLRAEAVAQDALLVYPPLIGAWARHETAR